MVSFQSTTSSSSSSLLVENREATAAAAYPAIAWAQAQPLPRPENEEKEQLEMTQQEGDNDAQSIPPDDKNSNPEFYGWEPTRYPDPSFDPLRCGIAYLTHQNGSESTDGPDHEALLLPNQTNASAIDSAGGSKFEYDATSATKAEKFDHLKLCDPDWVLGGVYLEQIASALADFSEQFSDPRSIQSAATTPIIPPPPGWDRRRHLLRSLKANATSGAEPMQREDNVDRDPVNSTRKGKPEESNKLVEDRSERVGLVVEAESDDDGTKAEEKKPHKKEKKGPAIPAIELAVATVRKVRIL